MQLSCIHCGKPFTITTEQLGGRGSCPHCQGEIRLPTAIDNSAEQPEEELREPSHWLVNSISGLTSLVFHMIVFIIFALISFEGFSGGGQGNDILIGEISSTKLGTASVDEFTPETPKPVVPAETALDESLEVVPPIDVAAADETARSEQLAAPSPSLGGADTRSFDLGASAAGGGIGGGNANWGVFLRGLQQHGLDMVVCFDSTGSMGGEIREVKEQIRRIGDTLLKLVPKARVGICTYRDEGDEYVVRGLPLTGDIQKVTEYLAGVEADAGGDRPEAVHRALKWCVDNNTFRSGARKVILLFGDAPPHREHRAECLSIASDFARQQKGIVSTVTCRSPIRLAEFEEIAQMGGGEAFLTTDERQIMTQLMVLVFGSRHREKVLEAFRLLER